MLQNTGDSLDLCIKRWRCIFRVFGLAPFSFDGDSREMRLVCRLKDRFWSALWILLVLLQAGFDNWLSPAYILDFSTKELLSHYLNGVFRYATTVTCMTKAVFGKRTQMIYIFSEIAIVDKGLTRKQAYEKIWPVTGCFIVGEALLIGSNFVASFVNTCSSRSDWICILLSASETIITLIFAFEFTQFIILVLLLKCRFKAINKELSFPLEHAHSFRCLDYGTQCSDLRKIYCHLYEATQIVSDYYGLPLLLGTLWSFGAIVSTISHAFGTQPPHYPLVIDICLASIALCLLTVTCGTCHVTTKESAKTEILIQKLLLIKLGNCLEKDLNQFSSQVSVMRAAFNAYGLIEIGLPMFYTVIGAACTYIVVFAQIP